MGRKDDFRAWGIELLGICDIVAEPGKIGLSMLQMTKVVLPWKRHTETRERNRDWDFMSDPLKLYSFWRNIFPVTSGS